MAERLLEANKRGLWRSPTPETLDQLRAIAHQAEGVIENIVPLNDSSKKN
jgi:cobaltochelatase CobN